MGGLPEAHVKQVCQPGTEYCCRYLLLGFAGWGCGKHLGLRSLIDQRVEAGEMRARGDNCSGFVEDPQRGWVPVAEA